MSSSESDDLKKRIVQSMPPLCVFFYPNDSSSCPWYDDVSVFTKNDLLGSAKSEETSSKKCVDQSEKEEFWLGRRKEGKGNRKRRILESGKHVKSYLLMPVKSIGSQPEVDVPGLFEVLESVKNAWTPNKHLSACKCLDMFTPEKRDCGDPTFTMTEDNILTLAFSSRRLSVPEEVIRKNILNKRIPSDESKLSETVPDVAPIPQDRTSNNILEVDCEGDVQIVGLNNENHQSKYKSLETENDLSSRNNTELSSGKNIFGIMNNGNDQKKARMTQNDYNEQGKGIIKVKSKEGQIGKISGHRSVSPSVKESEDSWTSESLPSSSPVELKRQTVGNSSSGNVSSDSEEIKCTCAELTSQETSIDLFPSGNSTLSQTVSEKSISTQDTTVSIHSVSTGGSTTSANSNSTSPDNFTKTSAKETVSPDFTVCHKRKKIQRFLCGQRYYNSIVRRKYPKVFTRRAYCRKHRLIRENVITGTSQEQKFKKCCQTKENCLAESLDTALPQSNAPKEQKSEVKTSCYPDTQYKSVKYTEQEIYMMQQMRHRQFIENNKIKSPDSKTSDMPEPSTLVANGGIVKQVGNLDNTILIPRYSALPRTLSMLVNTSGDLSAINSDSDSQSLVDSLEDFPVNRNDQFVYDTKNESKPVRGEVKSLAETKKEVRKEYSQSRAFFVSFTEPFEDENLIPGAGKIPEPPERIKKRINERQQRLLCLHKRNVERRREEIQRRRGGTKLKTDRLRENFKNKKQKQNSNFETVLHCSSQKIPEFSRNKTKQKIQKKTKKRDGERVQKKETDLEDVFGGFECVEENKKQTSPVPTEQPKTEVIAEDSHEPEILTIDHESNRSSRQFLLNETKTGKFRRKFEVIPEEKSSSLSSSDEKKTKGTDFKDRAAVSLSVNPSLERKESAEIKRQGHVFGNASNLVFARLGRSLKDCFHGPSDNERPVILFSPKKLEEGITSRKGRDALIAMNREDFNRLSKGWINFYILKEASDISEAGAPDGEEEREASLHQKKKQGYQSENQKWAQIYAKNQNRLTNLTQEKKKADSIETDYREKKETVERDSDMVRKTTEEESKCRGGGEKMKEDKIVTENLNESLRFHSSNTVIRAANSIPPKTDKRLSLPELRDTSRSRSKAEKHFKNDNLPFVLPRMPCKSQERDGMDSDTTVYYNPPSYIVPRLTIEGSSDSQTGDSLSNSENDYGDNELLKLPVSRLSQRKRGVYHKSRQRKERRHEISRCGGQGRSDWSVTVSGALELTNTTPDLKMRLSFPASSCGPLQASQSDSGFAEECSYKLENCSKSHTILEGARGRQRWTVTVENQKKGEPGKDAIRKGNKSHGLPVLNEIQTKNLRSFRKSPIVHNDGTVNCPRVESDRDTLTENFANNELSVKGNAVPMEKKPRPPLTRGRDFTNLTAGPVTSNSQYLNKMSI